MRSERNLKKLQIYWRFFWELVYKTYENLYT
jgi:hypothetical protein